MSQSQSSFLESVVSWDTTQCRVNLDTALPRLVECFQEINVVQEQIGILKIICHSFLPCVEVIHAEEKLFSKIIDEVCQVFDRSLEDIYQSTQRADNSSLPNITSGLEALVDLLEFLEICLSHVQNKHETLDWSHIHSLPRGTIHFLKGAYGHCKSSGEQYQSLLNYVSGPLSNLFKKTHSLQVTFLRLLDNVRLSDPVTEQDVQDLHLVCHGLFDVCRIVTSLDMKLVVTLWKSISKHAVSNKVHLGQRLQMGEMISHLCGEIQTGFTYLLQLIPQTDPDGMILSQGDEKGFQKSLKILGFQMKILVMLVREFADVIHDCEEQIYSVLITFLRLLPPSLSAQQMDLKHIDEIRHHLTNATDVLMKCLLSNRVFMESVTGIDKVGDLATEDSFPHLQIVLKVLDFLPQMPDDVQERWVNPTFYSEDTDRLSLIDVMFQTTAKCNIELSLPLILEDSTLIGKPERKVTLYENCCTRLCGFLGGISAKHFHKVEEVLLKNVLSCDLWCRLLAEDVWCFLVRYSSADLCRDHVTFLLELMKGCSSYDHKSPGLSLIVRLIKCLAPEHQVELIQTLSCEEDPISLFILACSVQSFSDENCQNMVQTVSDKCAKILQEFTVTIEKTQQSLNRMLMSMSCLCEILSEYDANGLDVLSSVTMSITDSISRLWREMFVSDWTNSPLLELCLGKLILLSSHLTASLENEILYKILSVMSSLTQQECSLSLHLIMVSFLSSLGTVRLSVSPEPQMLKKICDLFVKTLASHDPFIYHHGLSAFTKFAENTVHESVVPDCIDKQPKLQDCVVMFLNKTPYPPSNSSSRLQFLTSEPPPARCDRNEITGQINEPNNKRPRLLTDRNHSHCTLQLRTDMRDLVFMLRKTLSELEADTENSNMSPQTWHNLEKIHQKITDMKENG
ncbi:uncharacterized protein C1orf112-like isoform X2 [Ostrea edulis]|uniref:uncharacterized protein C1orf112-like isoform X2 n=1 Tax=Ostrea edulis TaxID=37623 RepID=UPI0024AF69D6|nr:uncharacterized protein C1orf112-like isoform X2 [Ostrea edulis]